MRRSEWGDCCGEVQFIGLEEVRAASLAWLKGRMVKDKAITEALNK